MRAAALAARLARTRLPLPERAPRVAPAQPGAPRRARSLRSGAAMAAAAGPSGTQVTRLVARSRALRACAAVAAVALFLKLPARRSAARSPPQPAHTNRLAREESPYLRQHAHNPVDWYPWCALAAARTHGNSAPRSRGSRHAAHCRRRAVYPRAPPPRARTHCWRDTAPRVCGLPRRRAAASLVAACRGEEAFAKARREDKPIFLSVGYSTCHWCHVMEHESFESDAVAELLNHEFVSIKVVRCPRPRALRLRCGASAAVC
jgi:hypothetical protein